MPGVASTSRDTPMASDARRSGIMAAELACVVAYRLTPEPARSMNARPVLTSRISPISRSFIADRLIVLSLASNADQADSASALPKVFCNALAMRYSTGSSSVMTLRVDSMPRIRLAMVVDLPDPTTPASTMAPPSRSRARSRVEICWGGYPSACRSPSAVASRRRMRRQTEGPASVAKDAHRSTTGMPSTVKAMRPCCSTVGSNTAPLPPRTSIHATASTSSKVSLDSPENRCVPT
ncbi:hypothetical protein D3C85_415060 [compost metagenome]